PARLLRQHDRSLDGRLVDGAPPALAWLVGPWARARRAGLDGEELQAGCTRVPRAAFTARTRPSASSPCAAMMAAGLPWGRKASGRATGRTLPARPCGASASMTALPKPPLPTLSSTVTSTG